MSKNKKNKQNNVSTDDKVVDVVSEDATKDEEVNPERGETESTQTVDESPSEVPVAPEAASVIVEKQVAIVFGGNKKIETLMNRGLEGLRSQVAIDPEDGGKLQVIICNNLLRVLGTYSVDDVKEFLDSFLSYIVSNSDDYSPTRAWRFFDQLPGFTTAKQREFEMIMRLLIDAAEPTTRKLAVKTINWEQIEDALSSINGMIIFKNLQIYFNV